MARPALEALKEQQRVLTAQAQTIVRQDRAIRSLKAGLMSLAELAGAGQHVASILRQADEENPAQPIPQPADQAPPATTQETRAPEGTTDVTQPGPTPVDNTAADGSTDVTAPGGVMAPAPADKTDVTAPVAGTTEMRPQNEVQPEPEIQTRPGIDTEPAFPPEGPFASPATLGSVQASGNSHQAEPSPEERAQARVYAHLRLAKLRKSAGLADPAQDDLVIAQGIETQALSDDALMGEIDTLQRVVAARTSGQGGQPAPRRLVPRVAGVPDGRSVPSMAGGPSPGSLSAVGAKSEIAVTEDEILW